MEQKIISKGGLADLVNELAKKGNLIGAKDKGFDKFEFAPIGNAGELRLDYDVTVTPPKKFFQPPKETLLTFKRGGDFRLNAVVASEGIVLFGIHPYDMKALRQMDKVFADDNRDTNYWEKRGRAVVVGVDPVRASKWAFWGEMGASFADKGYDLWLTDLGDRYFIEVATNKGERLLRHAAIEDATEADVSARSEARARLASLCDASRKIKINAGDLPNVFEASYEHPVWERKARTCYSCGSCNLVCPTCYCFDVREEIDLDLVNGRRVRLWDGCLLEEFAAVGHGENFRGERSARFRHRLMRKMTYMNKKVGELACVGCGRCSSVCLPDIADPVKVINELNNYGITISASKG
jgi:formate hydrogenlyase subunit 6/NADH:ubiquinone oxidoreductase subunit I